MSSIRAAARAALARKQREAEAVKQKQAPPTRANDVVRGTGTEKKDEEDDGAAKRAKVSKPTTVKGSRWGSSDEEDEDEDVREGSAPDATRPTTANQGYMEKMLAEANSFAAAQRENQQLEVSGRKHSQSVEPKSFFAPSPSTSDEGEAAASAEAGPSRPPKQDTLPQSLAGELAELESDEEKEPMAGPARPRAINDEEDDLTVGPARPDPEAMRAAAEEAEAGLARGREAGSSPVPSTNQVEVQLQKRPLNMLQACRSVDEFERLNKIDEGTYGIVFKARDKKTGEVAALKRVKMDEATDGFPLTALREVNILLSLDHPSIVNVNEVVVGSKLNFVFMVMEYVENDLKGLMDQMAQSSSPKFTIPETKALMLQLLSGMSYLHENWIMHRDLKMSNILVTNSGDLKICDFGLARQFGGVGRYTQLVVTLWYRAPELLLGSTTYGPAIDVWSLGCIFGELLAGSPLFNGRAEIDQLQKIFKLLGTPNDKIWPEFSSLPSVQKVTFAEQPYNKLRQKFPQASTGLSDKGYELLNHLLTYDPARRLTCSEALNDAFFEEYPPPQRPVFMNSK